MLRISTLVFCLLLALSQIAGATESVTYYHNDALGSPVAATDDNGDLLWEQSYTPWGEPLNSTDNNERWFTGAPYDDASALTYLQARWHSPAVGRFLAIDPVDFHEGNIHSFNRYAYANNNPYVYIDPDGRSAVTAFGGLLYESYQFARGRGFDGSNLRGALIDGYDGQGGGFAAAAFEDATTFIPAGLAAGIGIKGLRLLSGTNTVSKSTVIGAKIERQMWNRGWSRSSIMDTIRHPSRVVSTRDTRHLPGGRRMNDPATAYYSRGGGYVVRNERTGDVVQISNRNNPNWKAPWD